MHSVDKHAPRTSPRRAPRSSRLFAIVLGASLAGGLMASSGSAQTFSFSVCGQTGREGPSQGMCDTEYTSTTLEGDVTVAGGIQSWTVPTTGRYRIEAWGGEGGTQVWAPGFPGGRGAYVSGEFDLVGGETILVLVGQRGGDTREDGDSDIDNAGPGGGGGSFVYRIVSDTFPLVAAGGGGAGSRNSASPTADQDGNSGTSGSNADGQTNAGSGGNGGLNNAGGSSYWAGGGSGWLTDGTGGNNSSDNDFNPGAGDPRAAFGGRAPRNGGLGGTRWDDGKDEGGDGGFGGGGGGGSDNMGGGGGGGYSGGGGGNSSPSNAAGGGGGSFNGGDDQTNTSGVNDDHGAVVITTLDVVPTLSQWALLMMALVLLAVGLLVLRSVNTGRQSPRRA